MKLLSSMALSHRDYLRKAGEMGWMIDCFPKFQANPVSSHLCWNGAVCRWPCWVATRWQCTVQTGWLSGLDPWWGLVHGLYGTRPLLKQIKLFIWRRKRQPTPVSHWATNTNSKLLIDSIISNLVNRHVEWKFTLGVLCATLQTTSVCLAVSGHLCQCWLDLLPSSL